VSDTRRFEWAPNDDTLDWSKDPVPAGLLVRLVTMQGLPDEAIRPDGTLDPVILSRLGWELRGTTLTSP
jgi:hypothetical protein